MAYIDEKKIEGLIAAARQANLRVDEKELKELLEYEDDSQEADDRIGLMLTDRNDSAHYYYSAATMMENEKTFLDLFEAALKMLGIREYEEKSEYIDSSRSEDIEIRIGDSVYSHNFKYGWASDEELLVAFAAIAADHSDKKIVEIHGPDESYILIVPSDFASFLHDNFTFIRAL